MLHEQGRGGEHTSTMLHEQGGEHTRTMLHKHGGGGWGAHNPPLHACAPCGVGWNTHSLGCFLIGTRLQQCPGRLHMPILCSHEKGCCTTLRVHANMGTYQKRTGTRTCRPYPGPYPGPYLYPP